jgi:hypothetical protein
MATLRIPTLQHLARNWRDEPQKISSALVRLALNPPTFNYNPLYSAARDLLVLQVPYEDVARGIELKISRPTVRRILSEVLPLINSHFSGLSPDFVQTIERRQYPIGRGLMVPFDPPMIYGIGGQLHFPWFSFWRKNPLSTERLSLFVTLVDEILLQDPDLEGANFEILDFSCPKANLPRSLTVLNARNIPRVSQERKREMLEVFAEGYYLALAELANARRSRDNEEAKSQSDANQLGLFD